MPAAIVRASMPPDSISLGEARADVRAARAIRGGEAAGIPGPEPLLVRALRGQPVERTPVWFMRQAGRCLPEYRALRRQAELFEICRSPQLTVEATLQPVSRLGVDAAILFSDITLPLAAIGIDLRIVPGVGPVLEVPIRTSSDLRRLRPFDPAADTPYIAEAVRAAVAELEVPLIGFAGGPFTLASYLIEGGPSKTHARTRAMMHSAPQLWQALTDRLAEIAIASLRCQIEAGAAAVQLFDSWVGALDPHSYRRHVLPATARIFAALDGLGAPRIHFGVGTGELLELMAVAGADAIGVDWHVPLDRARAPGRGGRRPGQPGSRRLLDRLEDRAAAGRRCDRARRGPRPRLQPRPRCAAGDPP